MRGNFFVAIGKALGVVVLLNSIAGFWYTRFDLTEDQRFTLSPPSLKVIQKFDAPVEVEVLLGGNLPPEFSKLKTETLQLLASFRSKNTTLLYRVVDPLEEDSQAKQTLAGLQRLGVQPASITVKENGKISQEVVFPWALIHYKKQTVKIPLLKNQLGSSREARINNSVQHLEYAFADAFTKLTLREKKKVAIIKGNGELEDIELADYLTTIREYYDLGAITLDSVAKNPQKVLEQLRGFDLALIAKPTEAFSEAEKYVMDQFIVSGGKSIWLIDQVAMELDSIFKGSGSAVAVPRNLNLRDFFFAYGVRIPPVLVNDLYRTQIVLATGAGNNSRYNPVPWYYHPMVFSPNNHPINTNLEAVWYRFASPIDTLYNAYHKTVLLQSSPLSKTEGTPRAISLNLVNQPPDQASYTHGNFPLAVLIEGNFTSMYKNRIKPVSLNSTIEEGPANAMIVISDGDVIKNQLQKDKPLELGYDKWTHSFYGNKEFLVNCINYLLEDTGLIQLRNKNVFIPLLDPQKIAAEKVTWQLITLGGPILLTLFLGFGVSCYRKRKFAA